jgi:nitric-oxide synthase
MSAEIASRNLSDEGRYNMLPKVAEFMGYEMNNRQLWKDKALIELNLAVIYSFDKSKVSIVDHHSASESFMVHLKKEAEKKRYVPGVGFLR